MFSTARTAASSRLLTVLFVVVGSLISARPGLAADEKEKKLEPPTPAEVKKVLYDYYWETWSKDWGNAKVEKLMIEVTEPKVGKQIEKQMGRGEAARPVYPAKAVVKIVVKYVGNDKPKENVIGDGTRDAFMFYKDAFDAWTFKTGSL